MAEAIGRPAVQSAAIPAAERGERIGLGCGLAGLLVAVGSVSWWALKGKHWAPITGTVVGVTLAVGCCVRERIGLASRRQIGIIALAPAEVQVLAHQQAVMALPLNRRLEASIRLGGEMARQLLEAAEGDPYGATHIMVHPLRRYFRKYPLKHESATWFGVQTCAQIIYLSARGVSAEGMPAAMLEGWMNVVRPSAPRENTAWGTRGIMELLTPVHAEATRFVFVEVISGRLPSNARLLDFLRFAAAPLSPTDWEYVTGPVGFNALDPARVQALRQQISALHSVPVAGA